MEIIAHRGYWKEKEEKNSLESFRRAKACNFGTETDFRDYGRKLKISHDMPGEESLNAEEFFSLYQDTELTLAINIKADGLQSLIKDFVEKYRIKHYFCFDMSVPDTLLYAQEGIRFFARESEYEKNLSFYEEAQGVWMDGFHSDDWITEERIQDHLARNKQVCIVSPELHSREHKSTWERYKKMNILERNDIILCTDYPEEALEYFYGENN